LRTLIELTTRNFDIACTVAGGADKPARLPPISFAEGMLTR
jgi:hypothetical protein